MDSSEKDLIVCIRSPSLEETLSVTISPNATILDLKQAIEPIHPHHPNSSDQRIIYSGRLLQDTEVIDTVVSKANSDVAPTFHLVVKPSVRSLKKQTSTQSIQSTSHGSSTTTTTTTSTATATSTDSTNAFTENIATANTPLTTNPTNTTQPLVQPLLHSGYHLVAINGQYFLAPVLVPASQPNVPLSHTHFITNPAAAYSPVYQQLYQTDNASQAQPLPQQQQQPQQPQQQQQRERTLVFRARIDARQITSIWLILKLAVVLFMLCQGASLQRIVIYHLAAFVFFLYQTGRLRVVVRRIRNQGIMNGRPLAQTPPRRTEVPPADNGAPDGTQQDNHLPNNQPLEGSPQETNPSSSTSHANAPLQQPTFWDTCKRCIVIFVASLWPTYGRNPQIAQAFDNNN
ncbi:hypothetical protein RMCBS344292_04525 [Rhizopus microsporus]|nr:hypothetical protein RMCBS344292_04525 [Rhizopus microsporus]